MAAMSCMIDSLTAEEARARLKDVRHNCDFSKRMLCSGSFGKSAIAQKWNGTYLMPYAGITIITTTKILFFAFQATLQIQDLQAKLVQLKGHKEIDLARLKFAAQALLGQGQGQSHFQQALESMEREKLS